MAVSAAAVAKAAAMLLTNEKTRKGLGWILVAIFSPVILLIALLCSLGSGGAEHNNYSVEACFYGAEFSAEVPAEFRYHIEEMRSAFSLLDSAVSSANGQMDSGNSLDPIRVKAVFYALCFGDDAPSTRAANSFVECFYTTETRTRTVEVTLADGTTSTEEEEYTVAVPVSLSQAYANLEAHLGREITEDDKSNIDHIYTMIAGSAGGGSYSGDPRPGAAGIGDGAGAWSEIDPDAPPSNPNHIIISGDAEVEAKAGASTGGETAAIGGGIVGEIPNDALSDDDHKVTGGSLTRYDPAGKKMENYSYDRRTPSQPEQPDDTENSDDEDDAPDTQTGEVPDRVKQMYEAMGVITHLDGTQELGDVTTAEYDPVNKVLSFDAHGTVFRMTGDSLRELAKEVHELRIRFLDGNGQEMEAVIPLARIKDLVGAKGAFELELSQEGLYRFHVIRQTGYDRKTFSDETALRRNGRELVLVYHVGDEEEKAQETARVEEAIARRRQEKEQWWGVVISGLEGGSLSGQPGLTQPGTGAVGDLSGLTTLSPDSLTTAQQPKQPASNPTVWKTFTGNIVKLAGGKQDSKKDDPAPSVGDLSGLPTLSPDSLTTVQQPETSAQQPEASTQQPETGGWVTDSQGDWVWKPGKDDSQPPDWEGNWETRKWIRDSQPPDLRGDWETRKWIGSSDDNLWGGIPFMTPHIMTLHEISIMKVESVG